MMLISIAAISACAVLLVLIGLNWRRIVSGRQPHDAAGLSGGQFRLLAEASSDGLLVSRAGRYCYANPAAVSILGASGPEQIIGKQLVDLVHPDDLAIARERYQTALLEGQSVPLNGLRVSTFV